MATAYIGLGSNLGDKRAMIAAARHALAARPDIAVTASSSDYRTPPWGKIDQDWFVNACAALETELSPHALLDVCLSVERSLGRTRGEMWGPRAIDLDIIDYDGLMFATPDLVLPHPHALKRAFVLVPLLEIAPDLAIGGMPIKDALASLDTRGIERLPD